MARVFKHRYADGHLSPKWYYEYRDHTGKLRRKVGSIDKRATEQLAAKAERESEQIRAGLIPIHAPQISRAIEEHLEEWERAVLASGTSATQAHLLRLRVGNVFAGCGWSQLKQIASENAGEKAQAWLAKQELSAQTVSHYITHLNMFARWCIPTRLGTNPFSAMVKPQASSDRKHQRRVITPEEFRRLIDTTRAGKFCRSMHGEERAALYLLAAYSGMRASECAAIRRTDLNLSESPSVTLDGQYTKNGEPATIPLPAWVAEELRPWVLTRTGLLWPGNWAKLRLGGKMLKQDLKACGIPYKDERERVYDFHALRCQYAVTLLLAGVGLVAVQKLMRHSDPKLTANIYAQLGFADLAADVAKIKRAG